MIKTLFGRLFSKFFRFGVLEELWNGICHEKPNNKNNTPIFSCFLNKSHWIGGSGRLPGVMLERKKADFCANFCSAIPFFDGLETPINQIEIANWRLCWGRLKQWFPDTNPTRLEHASGWGGSAASAASAVSAGNGVTARRSNPDNCARFPDDARSTRQTPSN